MWHTYIPLLLIGACMILEKHMLAHTPIFSLWSEVSGVFFNTGWPFLLWNYKKVSINISFQKVCLGWKLFPIINMLGEWGRGEVAVRMSCVEKIKKLIIEGMSIRHSRVVPMKSCVMKNFLFLCYFLLWFLNNMPLNSSLSNFERTVSTQTKAAIESCSGK